MVRCVVQASREIAAVAARPLRVEGIANADVVLHSSELLNGVRVLGTGSFDSQSQTVLSDWQLQAQKQRGVLKIRTPLGAWNRTCQLCEVIG
jgi:hypothetical protein